MAAFIPTCKVNVYDDTTSTDVYGDIQDNGQLVARNVPAHFTQKNRRVFNPVDGRFATVRYYIVNLPTGTDVKHNYTLENLKSGETVSVTNVNEPNTSIGVSLLRVEATRTDEA